MQSIRRSTQLAPIFALVSVTLCGCDSRPEPTIEEVWNQARSATDTALNSVENLEAGRTKREFAKLTQYEYNIVELPLEVPTADLQRKLSVLGVDGWDCAPPLTRMEKLLIFCKKRPESFLRYIPQTFLGKPG